MILHIDMDAFYASVEQRDRPELDGQPVIVGGTPEGRGVVSAANYAARQYGVHSAMPAVTARRLCPQGVFLSPRMERYAGIAREIRDIFHRYTPLVEPLSLDEAFLDVTPCQGLFGDAQHVGETIKQEIRDEIRLIASVGVAPVKFVAKIASDLEKPDGFVVVPAEGVQAFLDPLPIERLWGVGRRASETLHRLGVRTIGQLRQRPLVELRSRFGQSGDHLHRLANGIDSRHVVPDYAAKQISHEMTFAVDIADLEVLEAVLMRLTEQVARRLRRQHLCGQTVQLKIRFADFQTITRSQKLSASSDLTQEFWQAAVGLLRHRLPAGPQEIRLLGVGVSGLQRAGGPQQQQFDWFAQQQEHGVDQAMDRIKDRFGEQAVRRATGLKKKRPNR